MSERMRSVRQHIDAALEALPSDDDVDRVLSPRHTDLDNRVYLPRKVAEGFAVVRRELQAAMDELRLAADSNSN